MEPERRPIHKKGFRDVFCPYYGECLDDVVHDGWVDWDCESCPHCGKNNGMREIPWGVNHSIAYYEVIQ